MQISGILEIDSVRGVVYFHDEKAGTTRLRICQLPKPIPESVNFIDVTYKVGVSYHMEDEPSE